MRSFIAAPLSQEVRSALAEMQAHLRAFGADVKWTAVPSIHLTLKFLGEVDPAIVPQLATSLREAAGSERPFSLHFRGLGVFPDFRNPRVVWCGLDGDLSLLAALQSRVELACVGAGLAPEVRAFQPHLTLGRVRGKSNLQRLVDYIKIAPVSECGFEVGEFHIYQSVLKPQGAIYTVLETILLRTEKQP